MLDPQVSKLGRYVLTFFRPVTVTAPGSSIRAISRWFAGWKALKSLGHKLKMEALFEVAEIYLPAPIFSICISQLKILFEQIDSVLQVPAHGPLAITKGNWENERRSSIGLTSESRRMKEPSVSKVKEARASQALRTENKGQQGLEQTVYQYS